MRPTMREVHWLHLVGVLKDFTTNWCALGCGGNQEKERERGRESGRIKHVERSPGGEV